MYCIFSQSWMKKSTFLNHIWQAVCHQPYRKARIGAQAALVQYNHIVFTELQPIGPSASLWNPAPLSLRPQKCPVTFSSAVITIAHSDSMALHITNPSGRQILSLT